MFYDDEEELNEDVSIVLCLAVCSDGMRKPAEEEALRTSPLFSKEIEIGRAHV